MIQNSLASRVRHCPILLHADGNRSRTNVHGSPQLSGEQVHSLFGIFTPAFPLCSRGTGAIVDSLPEALKRTGVNSWFWFYFRPRRQRPISRGKVVPTWRHIRLIAAEWLRFPAIASRSVEASRRGVRSWREPICQRFCQRLRKLCRGDTKDW